MENEVAKFLLKEIDVKLGKIRKPLEFVTQGWLGRVREVIEGGYDVSENDEVALKRLYERTTEPPRLR